jgi:O-antigen/teichoic acid export membrane protein
VSLEKHVTKIGKLSMIYAFGGAAPKILGLALLPIFTHFLSPDQFGIVRLALQVALPLSILVQLGLEASLKSRYFRTDLSQRSQLIKTAFLGQIALGFLTCLVFSIAGVWVFDQILPNLPISPQKVQMLWLMIVWGCFFSSFIQLATTVSQLLEKAALAVSITMSLFLLRSFFGVIAVVWLGWQGFGRQGTNFIGATIIGIVSLWLLFRFGKAKFNFKLFKDLFKTGLTFVPHSFAGMFALAINTWLVNKMISTASVGIYAIAIQFAQFIQMPLTAFGNAAYPTLAKLMSDGSDESKKQQSRLYTLVLTGISVIALGISLFAPIAIELLVAPNYHKAKTVVPILVLAWQCQALYWVCSTIVFYHGGGLWLATATVSSMIANIILGFLLIPIYGVYGAAMAMVGCFLIRFIVIAIVGHKKHPLPWQIKIVAQMLTVVLLMALTDIWLSEHLSLAPAIGLKLLIFAATILLILKCGIISQKEFKRGKQIFLEKLKIFSGR